MGRDFEGGRLRGLFGGGVRRIRIRVLVEEGVGLSYSVKVEWLGFSG